jgi:hypothetical protein
MRHFSRWVFLNARECGALGDGDAAKACFELALRAAGTESRDFRLYRLAASCLGWKVPGILCYRLDRLLRFKPGADTRKLSWMEE